MTDPSESRTSHERWNRWLAALTTLLSIVLAARVLYRSPYAASDLRITPDEVEYAVCAQRIATLGRYDLELDARSVPPHSTPWFSVLLAPVYGAAPSELGNGILIVLVFAIAGVWTLQRVGERIGGPLAGVFAVIAVLATPLFPYTARLIMTDAPAAALAFAVGLIYLRARDRGIRTRDTVLAGALIALAFALRSVYLALLVPFAWRVWKRRERKLAHAIALLAPLVVVLVGNAIYNHATFGNWRRTGYQFWCAVPYDYPNLLLSWKYVGENLDDVFTGVGPPSLVLGAIGVALLLWRERARARTLLVFVLVTALPISALHVLYFYVDLRFHVYTLAWLSALGGIGVACIAPASWRTNRWLALAALAIAWFALPRPIEPIPLRRKTADEIRDATPNGAIVISGLEPVYLAALAPPQSTRTFVAASRDVEFANKVLVRERVDRELAAPRDAFDHRASGLLAHGASEAIARTADEMPEQIAAWVRAGKDVFLERSFIQNPLTTPRILGSELRMQQPQARVTRLVLAR